MATREKNSAVLLLSAGMDSAANLALSADIGITIKSALTIDYGQRASAREIAQAAKLAQHFGIEHRVFKMADFSSLVGSQGALLSKNQQLPSPSDLDAMAVIEKTARAVWVPNRNGVFLSLAAAMAESRGFGSIVVGFNAEEAVTFPDNSVAFMQATSDALAYSTANKVQVVSATATLTKSQIVAKLAEKKFPFELIWSCYSDSEKHCGKCESCLRLIRATEGHYAITTAL